MTNNIRDNTREKMHEQNVPHVNINKLIYFTASSVAYNGTLRQCS